MEIRDGKSAAILCSGSSLVSYLQKRPAHDLVIAVNRAVEAAPCAWWVFNDRRAFLEFQPDLSSGRPACFTTAANLARIRVKMEFVFPAHATGLNEFAWLFNDDVKSPDDADWLSFSLSMALVLAVHLGAAQIRAYGVDWNGRLDWDGTEPVGGAGRSEYRWSGESNIVGRVAAWAAQRGVGFSRATACPMAVV